MGGAWKDMIDGFLDYTADIPSPGIFRLWAGIGCVAAALERRVWVTSAGDCVFPGLYTLLVGRPGSGKSQAIRHVSALWYATKELKVAPHSVTKASLTDELESAKRTIVLKADNKLIEYHSLQIAASEFGVLVPAHDLDFLNFLNLIYDNDPNYRESRRTGARKIETINPQINILAGTQPAYLATLLPEEAWGLGFMTRMIMVYSGEPAIVSDLFASTLQVDRSKFFGLVDQLKVLLKIHGEAQWDEDAKRAINQWYKAGCPPEPDHSRLESYNSRRILHVMRLVLVSAAAAGHPLLITREDFVRATDWLIAAEATMPEIFRAMTHKSDAQVIQELHMYAFGLYARDKKWIHESRLIHFLQNRITTDKIDRILATTVRANILDKHATDPYYRPRPKNEHGVE